MYFQSKSVDVLARKYLDHLSSQVGVNLESGLGRQLIDVGIEQVVLEIDLLEQHTGVEQVGLVHVNVVCVVALERFWVDNIQGRQEPAATNVSDVLLKYNRHTDGKIIETTEEVFDAYKSLKEVRQEIDALDARKTELEEKIKLAFGDAEGLSFGGQTIATWKAPKASTKFDAKAFQAAHPDLAREFTVPSQGARRFLLK